MASKPTKDDHVGQGGQPIASAGPEDGNTSNTDLARSRKVTAVGGRLESGTPSLSPSARPSSEGLTTSREASPSRPSLRSSNIPQRSRSRKNSQELSPSRLHSQNHIGSTYPSAAAVQRALSAPRPQTLPDVDTVLEGSKADQTSRSGLSSPSWPNPPRLRSPPPSSSSSRKKVDGENLSNTAIKRMSSTPDLVTKKEPRSPISDRSPPPSGMRTPSSRDLSIQSPLETVEEGSLPSTPDTASLLNSFMQKVNPDLPSTKVEEPSPIDPAPTATQQPLSGSDKPESESKTKSTSTTTTLKPPNTLAKRSITNMATSKTLPGSEPTRTMTVETEPVTTLPPILGGDRGLSGRDGSGSIRTKPSSETIRPKKDKKRSTRKLHTLQAGANNTKADIFEAKVANAVDEADSSDSDETFVYESNPPDSRPIRHHSRTPSATSLASQADPHALRNKHGMRNGSQAVAGKKSMKFTSSYSNIDGENGQDSLRGSRNGGSIPRHHHIGRYSRAGHQSIMDNDSPFTQANKPSSPRNSTGNLVGKVPRPNSPRTPNGRLFSNSRKTDPFPYDTYDDAADDEQVPLLGSVRVNRNRHLRRPGSRLRQFDDPPPSCWSRYGACIIVTSLIFLVCAGTGVFLMAMNRSLMDVSIKRIINVLASEQELMLDLHVHALNPNLFPITVSDLDVNVFAESPYVGTAAEWRKEEQRNQQRRRHRDNSGPSARQQHHNALQEKPPSPSISTWPWPPFWNHNDNGHGGVDEGTDPIDEPGGQKLLLGRVFELDSPLIFEASPLRRQISSSVAELRLAKPGNKTEEGGSARWEKVLQHPFDLIVRGVIKYQLPLSSKERSTKIAGRVSVDPEVDDGDGSGNSTTTARRWKWREPIRPV